MKSRKRKQLQSQIDPNKTTTDNAEPYPDHPLPTPQDCQAVMDSLFSLHGFPPEFAKYRCQRLKSISPDLTTKISPPPINVGSQDAVKSQTSVEHEHEESVLDGLVKTVLSQNTTEVNSQRAFASLRAAFPTWDDVLAAEPKSIENAIRCGGLAPTKASCIKNILSCLLEKKGKLCLEYLRDLSVDEIKVELSHFKGIGPKTVACVLMFHLQQDDFPVDTHVFEIAKAIGWVPATADRNKTYLHLNRRIPNELKFDLNCLLYTHGKCCSKCTKKGTNQKGRASSHDIAGVSFEIEYFCS
ncbi:putative DNA glycosylase At3g47830 isoform X2 [Carica papaya]|uniref:putative DNA glycosylase At3g47830 isoform X2 n=1 Tax=Carica papaya TaxID=3649 RepID=UPI000B8D011E|nr:putative DNA glycosylase At3g47830 isoform X2 [Carica papaya]